MNIEQVISFAEKGATLGETKDIQALGADQNEALSIDFFKRLFQRVFDIAAGNEADRIMEKLPTPHLVKVSVVFNDLPGLPKLELTADKTHPVPSADCLAAVWTYEKPDHERVELFSRALHKGNALDQDDAATRNTLRLIGQAVTSVDEALEAGTATRTAILA